MGPPWYCPLLMANRKPAKWYPTDEEKLVVWQMCQHLSEKRRVPLSESGTVRIALAELADRLAAETGKPELRWPKTQESQRCK